MSSSKYKPSAGDQKQGKSSGSIITLQQRDIKQLVKIYSTTDKRKSDKYSKEST